MREVEHDDLSQQVEAYQKIFEEVQQQKLELIRQQPTPNEYVNEDVLIDFDELAKESEEKLSQAQQLL